MSHRTRDLSRFVIYGTTHLVGPDGRCVWCRTALAPDEPGMRWRPGTYVVDGTNLCLNGLAGSFLWWPCRLEAFA